MRGMRFVKRGSLGVLIGVMAFMGSSCAWIDDIGTIDKKGSYTFTATSVYFGEEETDGKR